MGTGSSVYRGQGLIIRRHKIKQSNTDTMQECVKLTDLFVLRTVLQ